MISYEAARFATLDSMFVGFWRKHLTRSMLHANRPRSLYACVRVGCVAICATMSSLAAAQYGPVDPFESSMRQMRSAIEARADGRHHTVLLGLRQLKDSRLLPLYECLLGADHWSIRVDGILGIAELSAAKTVDTALIEALPERTDRDNAVQAALAIKLIGSKEALTLAGWEELDDRARAVLCAEAISQGAVPDRAILDRLCRSKTPETAAIGEALLLAIGIENAGGVDAALDAIAALSPRSRASTLAELSGTIARFKLKGSGAFLTEALALSDLSAESRARLIVATLIVDPARGLDAWRSLVSRERTQLALVRAAHLLLASGTRASAEDWALLRNRDPLLEGIADAGEQLSLGAFDQFYTRLLGTGHRSTLAAASEGAALLGTDAERALGVAALALLVNQSPLASSLGDGLLRAIARLAEFSPDSFREALAQAQANVPLKDLFLFALAEAGTMEAATVAMAARAGASAKGDALIRILAARFAGAVSEGDLLALSKVAGASEPAVAAQAAWLWLRASGREQECISLLCAELKGTKSSP